MVTFLVQLESRVGIPYNRFISSKLTPAWKPIVVVIPETYLNGLLRHPHGPLLFSHFLL